MTVKELIKELKGHYQEAEVIFASDEELNTLRTRGEVVQLEREDLMDAVPTVVIYGLDGSEIEE